MEWNEQNQKWDARPVSEGGEHFNPHPGGSGSGSKASKEEAAERKAFIASYEKRESDLARDRKSLSYDPTNNDLKGKVQKDQQWLSDKRPKYDQLAGKQAEKGGYQLPAAEASGGAGDDIDAIFNESLGGAQP